MSNFRQPIVAYDERGHAVSIFASPPCVFVEVDSKELGPFYENMAAARRGATRNIDEILKAEKPSNKGKKK